MKKQHARLTSLTALAASVVVLGAVYTVHAAPAPSNPKSAPVRLRLSAERETVAADTQGKPHLVWAAMTAAPGGVHPGDILRYRVQAENTGAAPVTGLVVTQPVPTGTAYVARSAEGDAAGGAQVVYSLDRRQFSEQPVQSVVGADGVTRTRPAPPEAYTALRWRFPALAAKTTQAVTYQVRVR